VRLTASTTRNPLARKPLAQNPLARKLLTYAPLTALWFGVLVVTTRRQVTLSPHGRRRVLRRASTNLEQLQRDPHRVLFTSLLWFDGAHAYPYLPLTIGLLAPAEHRLGSARWLLTGLLAHIGATYASQGAVQWSIRRYGTSPELSRARDVGVSYFMLGVAGRMTAELRPRWRRRSRVGGTVGLAANLAVNPKFTEFGHLSAFLLGLAAGSAESRLHR
jgi:hypothetical protein